MDISKQGNLEQEYKLLIDENTYNRLKKAFDWQKSFTQVNYYYMDVNNELLQHDITMRIREKNGIYRLQVKVPYQNDNINFSRKLEFEKEISGAISRLSSSYYQQMLPNDIQIDYVNKIGHLTTQRMIYNIQGCEIALDKNEYLGVTDYELEIEFEQSLPVIVQKKLADENVRFTVRPNGKNRRYFNRYMLLNQENG